MGLFDRFKKTGASGKENKSASSKEYPIIEHNSKLYAIIGDIAQKDGPDMLVLFDLADMDDVCRYYNNNKKCSISKRNCNKNPNYCLSCSLWVRSAHGNDIPICIPCPDNLKIEH